MCLLSHPVILSFVLSVVSLFVHCLGVDFVIYVYTPFVIGVCCFVHPVFVLPLFVSLFRCVFLSLLHPFVAPDFLYFITSLHVPFYSGVFLLFVR